MQYVRMNFSEVRLICNLIKDRMKSLRVSLVKLHLFWSTYWFGIIEVLNWFVCRCPVHIDIILYISQRRFPKYHILDLIRMNTCRVCALILLHYIIKSSLSVSFDIKYGIQYPRVNPPCMTILQLLFICIITNCTWMKRANLFLSSKCWTY